MITALLASFVECIEALTVVLAVGAVLGWRGALVGAGLALLALVALVVILGPALTLVPSAAIHIGVGALLIAFGLRWLSKAVLRAAGVIPLRDEDAAYKRQTLRFRALDLKLATQERAALAAAFQITMLEGIEVVFIVLAVGAADRKLQFAAALGAGVALLSVAALGLALHRPIAGIPENALKFGVGILTCAFGVLWMGEGVGARWPGDDWSALALAAFILVAALIAIKIVKARFRPSPQP